MSSFTSYPLKSIDIINLCQHLVVLLSKFVTISLLSSLLLIAHFRPNKLRVNGLSPAIRFYMCTHCACSAMGLPYQLYTSVWALLHYFGPQLMNSAPAVPSSPFSPYALFWTGIWEMNYYTVAPIAVTFLALERFLTLKFGASHNFWHIKKFLIAIGVLTVLTFWCISSAFYLLAELPLQMDKVSNCLLVACVAVNTLSLAQTYTKNIFGIISIFCCMSFLWAIHSSNSIKNMKNRVIKFTIFAEISFNVLPGLVILIFNSVTNISLALYVGEIGITFCNIDALVCSIIYWQLLTKRNAGAVSSVHANPPKTTAICVVRIMKKIKR